MSKLTPVRVKGRWPGSLYNVGELCGLAPAQAEALARQGLVEILSEEAAQTAAAAPPPQPTAPAPEADEERSIAAMSVREAKPIVAKVADVATILKWTSEEKAQPSPRSTILDMLKSRFEELTGN